MAGQLILGLLIASVLQPSLSAPLSTGAFCSWSERSKRSLGDVGDLRSITDLRNDAAGSPTSKSWKCTQEMGALCRFRMPLLLNVSTYWYKTNIISQQEQREIIIGAARKWASVTRDLIVEWMQPGQSPNIDFFFAFIDGPNAKVGLTGDPSPDTADMKTYVRMDDAESWTKDWKDMQSYSLSWAVLHEFGHAFGLGHSTNPADIMYSIIQRTTAELNIGDILAIQNLYGAPAVATAAPLIPQPPGIFVPPLPPVVPVPPQPPGVFVPSQPPGVFVPPAIVPSNPSNIRPIGNGWLHNVPPEGLIISESPKLKPFNLKETTTEKLKTAKKQLKNSLRSNRRN